jgi:translation initiation factor 2 subunit 1
MIAKNFPKNGSLVIAQIDKIERYGAYLKLIEYGNVEAFMPLREVSTGWIKNIHEFLHKGRKIVCRVTDVNEQKNTIDISLKKVTQKESKEKIKEYNLENRISSLMNIAIKKAGLSHQRQTIQKNILADFGTYTKFHAEAVQSQSPKNTNVPEELIKLYRSIIESSKKQKKYAVSYTVSFTYTDTMSGIDGIKSALGAAASKGVSVHYLGAPHYIIEASGKDYPEAEKKAKAGIEAIQNRLQGVEIEAKKNKSKDDKTDIMESL